MKTLLAIYLEDYLKDSTNLAKANALKKDKSPRSPSELKLEQLKIYFRKQDLLTSDELKLVEQIQNYRNVVHAFKDAPLGNAASFASSLSGYLELLEGVNNRLPYPHNY